MASEIAQARNYIQHAGMNANNLTAKDLREKVARCVEELGKLVAEWDGVIVAPAAPTPKFINLSNHPVATWPTHQREAAAIIGEVEDPDGGMPTVGPELSTREVEKLADQLAARALVQRPTAAGVFGEPVLTAQLVHRLEGQGIACFAPAGARQVLSEDLADGSVRVTRSFRFHQWRPYRTTRG
ncbi:MAG: hypothetical protein IT374_00780 [Polyangiaceae bacterium]|nr:hypothetical protein [Polyangiaceae bacterium]